LAAAAILFPWFKHPPSKVSSLLENSPDCP
jgi:hypothetical protein